MPQPPPALRRSLGRLRRDLPGGGSPLTDCPPRAERREETSKKVLSEPHHDGVLHGANRTKNAHRSRAAPRHAEIAPERRLHVRSAAAVVFLVCRGDGVVVVELWVDAARPSPRPIRLCELPRPSFNFFQGRLLTHGFYNLLDFRIFPSALARDKEACMPRRDESAFRAHGLEGSQDAVSSGEERLHLRTLPGSTAGCAWVRRIKLPTGSASLFPGSLVRHRRI